ncbi:MAG TPA: 3-oxoadipate enol-lactonase [Amaricoccus sp.]|nr:3-oxoadipate enol-lactonase [Amaricoccus sp.]
MHMREINGVRLHHIVTGDPNGLPIVFANSLGTDFRIWDRVIAQLPAGLKILRYDMRGHGLSDAPEGEYPMADLVADVAGLMDAVGIGQAVFVGLSIGGVVAQGLAVERPDLVRAAVLSNTAAKIGTEQSWSDRIATVRENGIEAIADNVMKLWFSRGFHIERADELVGWRHMLTRTPLAGYLGSCAAVAHTDLRESTPSIRQPVLAIGGDADGSTPPDLVRETAATIPGARFELLHGAGHIPCVEAPDAYAALLTSFLKENGLG